MSNQLVITSGAKVRSLEGVITGTTGVLNSLPINAANGIPQLDVNGKILVSQLPNSVMEYKGTWNANTNTPTLVNGTGNQGDVYLCNVAGTTNFGAGPIAFVVGDQVIYSGSIWQRASGSTGTVTSVAVTESGDALTITGSPITTSGTINIGFAGTSAQYVAGNGSLITFPSLTGYVPYTGATADVNLGAFDLYTSKVWLYDNPNSAYGSMELTDGVLHFEDADGHSMVTMEDGYLTIANASTIRALLNVSALTANRDYAFPNASGTLALTSDLSGYVPTSRTVSTTSPLSGGGALSSNLTLSISQATTSTNGYLSSTDWTTFNGKQAQLNGTGFVKASGTTITYDNSTYLTTSAAASTYVPYTGATTDVLLGSWALFSAGVQVTNGGTGVISTDGWLSASKGIFLTDTVSGGNWSTGITNITARTSGLLITHNLGGGILNFNTSTTYTYNFPAADGTLALTSNLSSYLPLSGGTLTGALNGTSAVFTSSVTATQGNFFQTASSGFAITLRNRNANQTWAQVVDVNSVDDKYFGLYDVTNSAYRMVVTNGGNVGIGTTSPSYALDVNGTGRFTGALTGAAATFSGSVTAGAGANVTGYTISSGANYLEMGTTSTSYAINALNRSSGVYNYPLYIDAQKLILNNGSGGNVGIGTSSPTETFTLAGSARITGQATDFSAGTRGVNIDVISSSGNGRIYMVNGTGTAGDLLLGTANTERMRITSGGSLLINTTTDNSVGKLEVNGAIYSKGSNSVLYFQSQNSSSISAWYSASTQTRLYNNGYGVIGYFNETNGVYVPSSDINRKKDFEYSKIGLNEVLQLKPKLFRMKFEDENAPKTLGFIAQEVKDLIPQAYSETGEGDDKFIGLSDRPIIAALVKAVQEIVDKYDNKISILEAQIEELKAKNNG
jgi:hypothetical protein